MQNGLSIIVVGASAGGVTSLEQFVSGLPADLHGTIFVVLHVAALVADSYVDFGLADVLVPLASSWKPGAWISSSIASPAAIATGLPLSVPAW